MTINTYPGRTDGSTQAGNHGALAAESQALSALAEHARAPLTLTVAGGKGGVGKTSVALNLALVLARQGHRTLLLDGDLELANVNVMLGLYPAATLEHAIADEVSLEEVLIPVADNLDLLPGASGVQNCLDQPTALQGRFLQRLSRLESGYDRVIIDTAAGLQTPALHMIAAAHLTLVVITPDPTSLTDAFSLLKLMYRRGYRRQPGITVNMARGTRHGQAVFDRFAAAVSQYIGLSCHFMGTIAQDESIARSVTEQKPVGLKPSTDPSAHQFWALAEALSGRWSEANPRSLGFSRYWARLVERKGPKPLAPPSEPEPLAETASKAVEQRQEKASSQPGSPPTGKEAMLDQSWPAHFRNWLKDDETSPVERYETLNEWLSVLGEALDEDLIETLQTGLANMQWESLPTAQRKSAAAHFRQLAELVEPPKPTVEAPADQSPRYASDLYGSQDALLSRLREQPSGSSLSRMLEKLGAGVSGLPETGQKIGRR